jgi:type III secretory pathway component EscV
MRLPSIARELESKSASEFQTINSPQISQKRSKTKRRLKFKKSSPVRKSVKTFAGKRAMKMAQSQDYLSRRKRRKKPYKFKTHNLSRKSRILKNGPLFQKITKSLQNCLENESEDEEKEEVKHVFMVQKGVKMRQSQVEEEVRKAIESGSWNFRSKSRRLCRGKIQFMGSVLVKEQEEDPEEKIELSEYRKRYMLEKKEREQNKRNEMVSKFLRAKIGVLRKEREDDQAKIMKILRDYRGRTKTRAPRRKRNKVSYFF